MCLLSHVYTLHVPQGGHWQKQQQQVHRGPPWKHAEPDRSAGSAPEAPAAKKPKSLDKLKCFKCKQFGHLLGDCPQLAEEKGKGKGKGKRS